LKPPQVEPNISEGEPRRRRPEPPCPHGDGKTEIQMSEAETIYHEYFSSEAGRQRMEDAWLQFPEHREGAGDMTNAADFVIEGIVAHFGDRDWDAIVAELRPMVEAGLRA